LYFFKIKKIDIDTKLMPHHMLCHSVWPTLLS